MSWLDDGGRPRARRQRTVGDTEGAAAPTGRPAGARRRRWCRRVLLPVLVVAGALVAGTPSLGGAATAEQPGPAAAPPADRDEGPSSQRVVLVQEGTSVGTVERDYVLTVPRAGQGAPRPVVVALHGRAQSVEALRSSSGLEELGEREGYVSVFPSGHGGAWNAGTCCVRPPHPAMPDVDFLDRVLADVRTRTVVDPARVHVVGFSNGGMMAYRYACERSADVAGVGVVSGSMAAGPGQADAGPQRCRPTSPVSVVAVHGSQDRTVPYDGGRVAGGGWTVAPVRAGVDQAAVAAQCRASRTSRVGASARLDYADCAAGAAVRLVKLVGHGHSWTRDSRRVGYDTTVGMWSFLAPRRAASAP